MFLHSLLFEWRYFRRQPSFIVTCLVFFLLPFLALTVDQVQIGSGGNVLKNSPFAIAQIISILTIFAMFMVVNFVGNTASRNHTQMMSELIYTKPIPSLSYNLGRFSGSFLVCAVVYAMVPLGIFFGSLMPWVDAERLGPNSLAMYLTPYITLGLPTLLVMACLFYAMIQRTQSLVSGYVTALVLYIAYNIALTVFDQPDQRLARALLDPYGLNALREFTRYWTPFERNNLVPGLEGVILQNRMLWLAFGSFVLLVFGRLFKPLNLVIKRDRKKAKTESIPASVLSARHQIKANSSSVWSQFRARTWFEVKQTLSSPAFLILLALSMVQLVAIVLTSEGRYGAKLWPVTMNMVNVIEGAYSLLVIIILGFFTAEVVWRERSVGIGDITDSTPVRNFTFWMSKLIAIALVFTIMYASGIVIAIVLQAAAGHGNFELSQYLVRVFYFGVLPLLMVTALAFFLQAISPGKYIGMMLFAGYVILEMTIANLGYEHNMFNFAGSPDLVYSDMNTYHEFLVSHAWYMLYWGGISLVLSVLSYGLWRRGPSANLKSRFAQLGYQIGVPGKLLATLGLVLAVGAGYWVHYNTRVINNFMSSDQQMDLQAEYEKQYIQYADDNNPIVKSVDLAVDIFPQQRRVEADAQIQVVNKGATPITRFLVSLPQQLESWSVKIPGGKVVEQDQKLNTAWFEFDQPLRAGERRQGSLSVVIDHQGFKDSGEDYTIVENGSFFDNFRLLPYIGFAKSYLLQDRHERSKRGLEPIERAHALEDESRYHEHLFDRGMDFIDFSATLSTSPDQIAMSPGYLTKEWQEQGRRYFRYEMDKPMLNFYSITSARLAVKEEMYKGVNMAVYYHPNHPWNVDRMIRASKDSLDYFQEQFGPYQHRQYRIIEFPKYRSFAQSFANTIPYTENGFLPDLRDESKIDSAFFITAHEMAHQWWGHQLGAANVQGGSALSETLAEYSAVMVMQKKLGDVKARHFLKYELDDYLRGRSNERIEEQPLLRVESQPYIHYNKGSLVMMAIRHRLGEAHVNGALKSLLEEYRYKSDPYPTTLDLVRHLKTGVSSADANFIDDLFERITLYDLRAEDVASEQLDDGKYKITFTASAKKFTADGKGEETEQAFKQEVEIGLFSGNPNEFDSEVEVIYQQPHMLETGENTIEMIVDRLPNYVGVDPFIRLIDRDAGNNLLKL